MINLERHLQQEEKDGLTIGKATFPIDGDVGITLVRDGASIAVSSISQGLEDYFICFDEDHSTPEPYQRAIAAAEGKLGIVQMQGLGKAEQRVGTNYKDLLTQHWLSVAEKAGLTIAFYLPAMLNLWQVPEMVDQMLEMNMTPSQPSFSNYDQTAKRNGFHYDPNSGLFLQ